MEDDLFDDATPSFSLVPCPDYRYQKPRAFKFGVLYTQEVRKFSLSSIIEIESSWEKYICQLDLAPSQLFVDYFSKRHQRQRIQDLKDQIRSCSAEEVQKKKLEANPYTLLKIPPAPFKYKGLCRMAHLVKLFPEILEKNFMLQNYQFLVIGDQGGLCEYISSEYANRFYDEPVGYALFPKNEFSVPKVKLYKDGDISFETIHKICNEIYESQREPTLMLILSDLSWKELNPDLEEKYMTMFISYSLYMSVKLLAKGGNLIVKLYNTYHPTTVELIYIIASLFTTISLFKPLCSSPHSCCRILVALDYKGSNQVQVFFDLSHMLERLLKIDKHLDHVLAFSKVLNNKSFQDYIVTQNSAIAETQITALQRVLEFIRSDFKSLKINKEEVTKKCLIDWKLKEFTEEEKRETYKEDYVTERLPDTIRNIKNEKLIDISELSGIINRGPNSVKLKTTARKRPEQIAPERSLDLQREFKSERSREVNDLRFFKNKGSKKGGNK